MVVTVSHAGYIKRVPLSTYRAQRRGGKGRSGMATRDEDFVTRLFVANTHTPVLFFSSLGQAYKEKVWRLPLAAPNAKGKALVNMLPLEQGERITTIMPLPEDEASWDRLDVMFATSRGSVRRNKLSDFVQVNRAGKIAMKLDEGEQIVDVQICTEGDDVLLTTAKGQCIRFAVPEVRVFKGRDSMGVRGIKLGEGRQHHLDGDPAPCRGDRRGARRLPQDAPRRHRRAAADGRRRGPPAEPSVEAEEGAEAVVLSPERYTEMGAAEQFILTVSERGYGKRTSSYEYRITGRGGKGITAMAVNSRNGPLVASFPVEHADQIMLVTNGGQLIRVPVDGIRIAGRGTQGVTVFSTRDGERVVSVEHIEGEDAENGDGEGEEVSGGAGSAPPTPIPSNCQAPAFGLRCLYAMTLLYGGPTIREGRQSMAQIKYNIPIGVELASYIDPAGTQTKTAKEWTITKAGSNIAVVLTTERHVRHRCRDGNHRRLPGENAPPGRPDRGP